jgi:hypothetical protein
MQLLGKSETYLFKRLFIIQLSFVLDAADSCNTVGFRLHLTAQPETRQLSLQYPN